MKSGVYNKWVIGITPEVSMYENTHRTIKSTQKPRHRQQPLRSNHDFYIGIDIGSTSSDVVVLDDNNRVLICDYRRTNGKPIETVHSQLHQVLGQINPADVVLAAATGSVGRFLAKILQIQFVNEVPAQATAITHLYPNFRRATIIEMGGQDSKLIFLSSHKGQSTIRDFALNSVCAAGTGSFLDQQAQRLGIDIEDEFGRLALQSENVPRMAGRCSVFAKSDMIHLQQQASPVYDIIAGLCLALARNLKSNLGCGRNFIKPIIFTGGVAANIGVVRAVEQIFELAEGQLIVPDEHFFTGAIGAVLTARNKTNKKDNGKIDILKIDDYLEHRGATLQNAPRREKLDRPSLPSPESKVCEYLLSDSSEPIDAYLGVDVGSISTNVVVMNEQRQVLAKAYLMTAGKPLEAVRSGLNIVAEKVASRVKILGAATTGSGRYLTGDFIGADVVINEITAQAAGATIINPDIDTIFEIGGQDSKYISLQNGVVVDFEMNHACAAGTGSFLEEQAQRLGININAEFAKLALNSSAPIKLGERCTVFMESDLLNYQQQGAGTEDLVAGLSYSIVTNYLNRVVGRRKVGNKISFQGGTAFNKAVWAAFEKVTGKQIIVPDHHEVTGALGAASIVAEHMAKNRTITKSTFKGFDNLGSIEYKVESFTCEHCPNHCEIKKVLLPQSQPLYYGCRCDRYNLKKKTSKTKAFDAFGYRMNKLLEFSGLDSLSGSQYKTHGAKRTIGMPAALINWQFLPLFARFFRELGFEPVLSGKTNKEIIRNGVETVTAQPCFPVKVAYGHIADLIDKNVDYIFLPSIVSTTTNHSENSYSQLCPYVQSLPYQVKTAFCDKLGRTKFLTAPIRMGEGKKLLENSFILLGKELMVRASLVRKALEKGIYAQQAFQKALKQKGAEVLDKIAPDQKLFVLVSRPYNGCDEGLNLQLPQKLAELGVQVIPMDMLDIDSTGIADESLYQQVYWMYGQKILKAAEIIKSDNRLFAIYLSNFSCGPDSFLMTFFKDIMADKPSLLLELDEHSADAGIITRLEAFFESLKHYNPLREQPVTTKKTVLTGITSGNRTLYIPYMSDCSYGVAACFRAYGQASEVMPIADEAVLLQGRKYTTGKECLPCAITIGDMLEVAGKKDSDKIAFFMPDGNGPCRFGMYNCMHRLILKQAGLENIPVISPNQDGHFYKELIQTLDGTSTGNFLKDIWSAAVGIELLHKLLLKLRPFAENPSQVQQLYDNSLKQWVQSIEQRTSLTQKRKLMSVIAEEFASVRLDHTVRKPRIGIVGEIYVRNHPFANGHIISKLEEFGAACDLAHLAEWVYYINFVRSNKAKRNRHLYNLFTNSIENYLQHKIEAKLAEPLERKFGKMAEEPTTHLIELAQPYIHHSFEGEAVLSVGKMIEYYHKGIGGVVNVMPFSCMPSTIVTTQTRRISDDCNNMPILNLSFDGQEDSTMDTRLEAFVEQIRQNRSSAPAPAQPINA